MRSVTAFLALTFALGIPFWLFGAMVGGELLPGLPVAALSAVCPMTAAAIVVYRERGSAGVTALLMRSLDFGRIGAKVWYAPALLLMPGVMALSFGVLRLSGVPVPAPRIAALPTLALCAGFFLAALGEELGWSGYAVDPMRERWGALPAGLILGSIWAIYHYVPLAQEHRSLEWVAWWSLETVALRVILVWLYVRAGQSVFAATLLHMTVNVTWQLFPVSGSYYDPRVVGSITAVVAAVVVVTWGPRAFDRLCWWRRADVFHHLLDGRQRD